MEQNGHVTLIQIHNQNANDATLNTCTAVRVHVHDITHG